MAEQLIKKTEEGHSNVMPKSWIEAITDKSTGESLTHILQGFNMYFLSYTGNTEQTRCQVPKILRKKGLWITYVKYDGNVYTEWYNSNNIDDKSWGNSSNWRVGNNELVGDLTISANGNWVINGNETEFKAIGEKGNTPLIRVANNKLQVSYDTGNTYHNVDDNPVYTQIRTYNNKLQISTDLGANWVDASDEIAAYFRFNSGQGNNVGNIQISRNNKDWNDLSGNFVNNLHISKYIEVGEALPTSGIAEGTIYAKGPTYAESDTSHNNPIYRLWVYAYKGNTLAWQDNGEFTSIAAGVVQETGSNEKAVMSQKATSVELNKKANAYYVTSQIYSGAKKNFFENIKINQYGTTSHSEGLILMDGYRTIYPSKDITCSCDAENFNNCIFVIFDEEYNVVLTKSVGANITISKEDFPNGKFLIASFPINSKSIIVKQGDTIIWEKHEEGTLEKAVLKNTNYIEGETVEICKDFVYELYRENDKLYVGEKLQHGCFILKNLIEVEEGTLIWNSGTSERTCLICLLDKEKNVVNYWYSNRTSISIDSNVKFVLASFIDTDNVSLIQEGRVLFDKSMIGSKTSGLSSMVESLSLSSKEISNINQLLDVKLFQPKDSSQSETFNVNVNIGSKYIIYIPKKWKYDYLGNGNTSFFEVYDENKSYIKNTALYQKNGAEYFYEFYPLSTSISVLLRKDKGETAYFFLIEMTKKTDLCSLINQTFSFMIGSRGQSIDIIESNGGEYALTRQFQSLSKTFKNKPLILSWTSDVHHATNEIKSFIDFSKHFSSYVNDMIHTGDTVIDKIYDTNVFEEIENGNKVINIIGNHDCYDPNHTYGELDFADGIASYNKILKNNISNWGVIQPTDAESQGYCYFYKDYSESKIRLICLDCMHWDNNQKTWFENILNTAITNKMAVIAATHYMFTPNPEGIRECGFHSVYGEKYFPMNAQSLNGEAESLVHAAIEKGLSFICWIQGHAHCDFFVKSRNYPEQYGITVTRTSSNVGNETDSLRGKYKGKDAFNILAVDTTVGILTIKRIGDNYDKFLRKRDILVFDYINHKIIG